MEENRRHHQQGSKRKSVPGHGTGPRPGVGNQTPPMRITVCPATGGQIEVKVAEQETVAGLKWLVSRKLRIPPEKITLLHRNRQLNAGTLICNHVCDGSRITLLPNMESGMSLQKTDVGVIQMLENLSDSQISDFLSGKAPLLLAMRLGDHMMFVQLQLSTAPCISRRIRTFPNQTPTPPSTVCSSPVATPSPMPHETPPPSPPPASMKVGNCTVTGTSSQGPPHSPTSLTRASRNLSQKLKELSRITAVTPQCSKETSPKAAAEKNDSGAIIESMHHLGHGVYSGTFSGTLDPTLQDTDGKPKRDISTIIHILNDLLGANSPVGPHSPYAMAAPPKRTPKRATSSLETSRHYSGIPNNHLSRQQKDGGEDESLRGKIQHLQKMMEERRLRRQARRHTKTPYQWFGSPPTTNVQDERHQPSLQTRTKLDSVETVESVDMNVGEPVSESSYSGTAPMEHETVAV